MSSQGDASLGGRICLHVCLASTSLKLDVKQKMGSQPSFSSKVTCLSSLRNWYSWVVIFVFIRLEPFIGQITWRFLQGTYHTATLLAFPECSRAPSQTILRVTKTCFTLFTG